MTKIISGIIVASLLSGPSTEHMSQHNKRVYSREFTNDVCVLESNQFDTNYLKEKDCKDVSMQDNEVNKEKNEKVKIDELMEHIDEKNRNLKSLLKEKTKVISKIQTIMDLRAYTRAPLNERQINSFSNFTDIYTEKAGALQETLKKIDYKKNLGTTKKELLHIQADYSVILDELKSLSDTQSDAICYLHSIIESGERTLQAL